MIAITRGEIRMIVVEQHDIRAGADGERADRPLQGLCACSQRSRVQPTSRRLPLHQGHDVAGAPRQPLPVFQLPQLGGSVDLDVRIGPDAEAAARREIGGTVKETVAERRFGQRAETDHRPRGRQRRYLPRCRVGRVDHAPAGIERGILEQPFHRATAEGGDAFRHLPQLLGGVDMDRPVGCRLANRP